MRQRFFYLFLLATVLVSCSGDKVKYRIGVSQCSDDIWRDKQNAELKMGAYFHDGVELKTTELLVESFKVDDNTPVSPGTTLTRRQDWGDEEEDEDF